MKFQTLLLATIGSVYAADSSQVEFLTNLVNDYKSHGKSYLAFIATAKSVPPELTSLAANVATYNDDSYTTLLDNSDLNIESLQNFATELPWYSRIAAGEAAASGSGAESGSAASGSAASGSSSKSESKSESKTASKSASSESSKAMGAAVAPAGVILGALAVALL